MSTIVVVGDNWRFNGSNFKVVMIFNSFIWWCIILNLNTFLEIFIDEFIECEISYNSSLFDNNIFPSEFDTDDFIELENGFPQLHLKVNKLLWFLIEIG